MILLNKRFFEGLYERLGIYPDSLKKRLAALNNPLWVHAASLGEVRLLKNIPGFSGKNTLITLTSDAGKTAARSLFPEAVSLYMPIDIPFLHKRLIRLSKPSKLVILETELWPGLIYAAGNLPRYIFNGRLSDSRIRIYRLLRKPLLVLLKEIDKVYAAGEENYRRFSAIGVGKSRLRVLPNLKYNYLPPEVTASDKRYKKNSRRIILCGSTHPGEEEALMRVFLQLKAEFNDLILMVSPRKIERSSEVQNLSVKSGIKVFRWSAIERLPDAGSCVIIDTLGDLPRLYNISDIAFIGGSLVKHGGHNMIEAASCGVPVITGPYNNNFRDIASYLEKEGGEYSVSDEKEMYNRLREFLRSPDKASEAGRRNLEAIRKKRDEVYRLIRRGEVFS